MKSGATRTPRRLAAVLAFVTLSLVADSRIATALGPHAPPAARATERLENRPRSAPFLRGMVISCPRYGQIWGSAQMAESLVTLEDLGVDSIAIHPYAGVRRSGEIRWTPAAETGYLSRAGELVRGSGLGLFWKPHLAYWGSFSWRGEIDFGDDRDAWSRFFDGYREFIVDQARFAQSVGAEILAVGVELEGTTGHEAEWRAILADVRRVYRGRITYAANWDSLDEVPFWDAVDLIGVHAYFPLADGTDPDRRELEASWDRHLESLRALSRRHDRPVLLAEIGYSRSREAAERPWEPDLDGSAEARDLRRSLLEVALTRFEREGFIEGMFWWKWMPGPAPWDRDFSMKDPEARELLAIHWGSAAESRRPTAEIVTGD